MPSKSKLRRWGRCERKIRYATEEAALTSASKHNVPEIMRPYPCPYCRGWHLTSQPHEAAPRLSERQKKIVEEISPSLLAFEVPKADHAGCKALAFGASSGVHLRLEKLAGGLVSDDQSGERLQEPMRLHANPVAAAQERNDDAVRTLRTFNCSVYLSSTKGKVDMSNPSIEQRIELLTSSIQRLTISIDTLTAAVDRAAGQPASGASPTQAAARQTARPQVQPGAPAPSGAQTSGAAPSGGAPRGPGRPARAAGATANPQPAPSVPGARPGRAGAPSGTPAPSAAPSRPGGPARPQRQPAATAKPSDPLADPLFHALASEVQALADAQGDAVALELLGQFGVERASQLPKDQWQEALDLAKEWNNPPPVTTEGNGDLVGGEGGEGDSLVG